ncbi:MAG TPA: glycosyltransferase family 4 protein [Candidatus Saccharimonadales bacterium]|nr:glycosyltransferase family 4 protein [Candidatus Saccharimonadales bacterium]
MKIIIYQPRISYYVGGGEVVPANHASELVKLGHDVEVLTTRAPFIKESPLFNSLKKIPGITIRYIDVPQKLKWIYDTAPGADWERWDNESLHVGLMAREVLCGSDADLIITHLLFDAIACPSQAPSVLHLHGYPPDFTYHHKLLAGLPDAFISVSEAIAARWKKILPPGAPSLVVQNGIDEGRYKPAAVKQTYDLMYIGRLLPVKGIDTLIEAASFLPGIKVAVAGTGPMQSELQRLAKRKKVDDRVSFLGYVPDKDLPNLYNSAKIVALPSKDKEGILTTLLEAASCARPVITTSAGSMSEFIDNMVNGVIVSPDDPKELSRAARKLLEDEKLRVDLGERARRKIMEGWTWSQRIAQLETVYLEIASKHRRDI